MLPFAHLLKKGAPLEFAGGKRIEDVRKQPDSALVRGFAAWALEGLARLYNTGEIFRAPVVEKATAKFWKDTDPLGDFWDTVPMRKLDDGIHTRDLRQLYEAWCRGVGVAKPFGPAAFKRACESVGLRDRRFTSKNIRGWKLPADPNRVCERRVQDPHTGRFTIVPLNVYGNDLITGEADESGGDNSGGSYSR